MRADIIEFCPSFIYYLSYNREKKIFIDDNPNMKYKQEETQHKNNVSLLYWKTNWIICLHFGGISGIKWSHLFFFVSL